MNSTACGAVGIYNYNYLRSYYETFAYVCTRGIRQSIHCFGLNCIKFLTIFFSCFFCRCVLWRNGFKPNGLLICRTKRKRNKPLASWRPKWKSRYYHFDIVRLYNNYVLGVYLFYVYGLPFVSSLK